MHMMRRHLCTLTQALTLVTLAVLSQQSLADTALRSDTNRYGWVAQTATAAGRVRVTITKQKPRLYLAKLQQPKLLADDQDDDYYDDLPDVQVGYRRPELVKVEVADTVPDDIKIRLALARMKALKRYEEVWG